MTHPTPDDLLRAPLLAGLSPEAREQLALRFSVEEYSPGRAVTREGTAGYAFYVLDRGTARVTQDGRELNTLSPGDFFGEISILGDGHRTATVTAVDPMVVWTLFGTDFRVLQAEQPDVAAALETAMQERTGGS